MKRQFVLVGLLAGLLAAYWATKSESTGLKNLKQSSLAKHWQETTLIDDDLFEKFDSERCYITERQRLGCLNALIQMAQKMNFKIDNLGQLEPISLQDNFIFQTEKNWLQAWQTPKLKIVRIDFLARAMQLLNMAPSELRQQLVATALNAYFSVLQDPHTYIVPRSYYDDVIMNGQPEQSSFGFVIGRWGHRVVIKKIQSWSPAKRENLKIGDEILEIQGLPIRTLTQNRLSEVIREALTSSLVIKVRRENQVIEAQMNSVLNATKSVLYQVHGDIEKVGIVQINKFAAKTCEMVSNAVNDLKSQLVRGIILDLRDNPGGSIEEAGCVVGLFVGMNKLAYQIKFFDTDVPPEDYITSQMQIFTGRLAVLVNNSTASAAELVAGSLQDHRRALLLGQRTFGKGSFQEGRSWKLGTNIILFETKGLYYLPSGVTPQLNGVEPNVELSLGDSFQVREQEQYFRPISNPNSQSLRLSSNIEKKLRTCLQSNSGSELDSSPLEDEQLNQGVRALGCQKQIYANRADQTF